MMYRKKCTNLIDVMIIDKSTLTDDNKLIDEVWKDFLEDYKHMQTLTEDTRKSSLFSQMINKTNMVLSDEEEEEYQSNYIDPPIKNPNDVEKERLISLNKVQKVGSSRLMNESKSVFLFRHSFFDENDDRTALIANILYIESENEIKFKTYDSETGYQDETYISLMSFYSNDEVSGFNQDHDLLREKIKELISIHAKLERDSFDNQYKLLFMPTLEDDQKTSYVNHLLGNQSDSDDENHINFFAQTSKYDISAGVTMD